MRGVATMYDVRPSVCCAGSQEEAKDQGSELPTMFQSPGLDVFDAKGFCLRGLIFLPKG